MKGCDPLRSGRVGRRDPEARHAAAHDALALCGSADALAHEAAGAIGVNDDHLFDLLQQRDALLQNLAEPLAVIREDRPVADRARLAATERAMHEADALLLRVQHALSASHRITIELAAKVAQRSEEIRAELHTVQRASSAGLGYAHPSTAHAVDRIR